MKAVALTALRKLEVIELPIPALRQPGDVLLRVRRVGVCGSDLHYYETGGIGPRRVEFPFVIGHECAATVVETGSGVTRVRPGDTAAVDPAMSCGQCDQCRQGRAHTCRQLRFLGCPGEAAGCLCEYLVLPETCLWPVGDRLTLAQAALCEPLSIALHATRLAQPPPGADVAVLGCGPIGLCVMAAARQAGAARAWATDRVAERITAACRAGAVWAGNPERGDIVTAILRQQPLGMDVVFECAGQQATLDQGVELLKPGGKLVLVGIPREERVAFQIDLLRRKEIAVLNVRRQNGCVAPAIELLAGGALNLDPLVTHRFRPEETATAFALVANYRDGVLKAMVEF